MGVCLFWFSLGCLLVMMWPVFDNPSLLWSFFDPYGQHKTSLEIHEFSLYGIPSLSQTWILSCAIFSQIYFQPKHYSPVIRIKAGLFLLGLGVLVFLFSSLGMTRVQFITYILILVCGYLTSEHRHIRLSTILSVGFAIILFVWLGQTFRTGSIIAFETAKSPFSLAVQAEVWAELIEKYLPGEMNSALIMMTNIPDVERNWLYGTMFHRFGDVASPDDGYFNTINSLGIWYWQFFYASPLIALIIGYFLGRIHTLAAGAGYKLGWANTLFFVALPGIPYMLRVNYFFLSSFIIPAVVLTMGYLFWVVVSLRR